MHATHDSVEGSTAHHWGGTVLTEVNAICAGETIMVLFMIHCPVMAEGECGCWTLHVQRGFSTLAEEKRLYTINFKHRSAYVFFCNPLRKVQHLELHRLVMAHPPCVVRSLYDSASP